MRQCYQSSYLALQVNSNIGITEWLQCLLFHAFSSSDAELVIPVINTMMPVPARPTSRGFTITWNEPALLEDKSFLTQYQVMIVQVTGHRKRQTSFSGVTDFNTREYTFEQGMPHTTYSVSVDGVLEMSGVLATVVALTATEVTTAEACEFKLVFPHSTIQTFLSSPPLLSQLPVLQGTLLQTMSGLHVLS